MAQDAGPPKFFDPLNANIYGALSRKVGALSDEELMQHLARTSGIAGRAPDPSARSDAGHVKRPFSREAERRGLAQ